MLEKMGILVTTNEKTELADVDLTSPADLRPFCSPVEDQGSLGSCTAHAGVGMVEYFQIKGFKQHIDASRRFLYKATRNLMKLRGDTGATIRSTMGAMVLFGLPPEDYWKYEEDKFDEEPTAFCYAFAQNYQAISYYRLDPFGTSRKQLLTRIKLLLKAQLPIMFGFTVYGSILQAGSEGNIPYPTEYEHAVGGHAVLAVGYDDNITIANDEAPEQMTKGAIRIRNSWGKDWGNGGYGWLPYEYVLSGLAVDWWSMIKSEWVETKQFGL